jgi:predicted nuclease with TOPRIM domain
MTLINSNSNKFTTLKISNMQSAIISNRFILGIIAFSISFGLSIVPNWDLSKALLSGTITVISTYAAAVIVDKKRRNYEMLVLTSLHRRIRELEGLKSRIAKEIKQIEEHHHILYTETQQLQNQIIESRNQRDSIHRDTSNFAGQKNQLESEITSLRIQLNNLDANTTELQASCTNLISEKRRLDLICNSYRAEITQLQIQIEELQQQKIEVESNLTLLGRLKPQLEEKMYELRIENQALENSISYQNELIAAFMKSRDEVEISFQNQIGEKQTEFTQLENQISLLKDERDILQNQVWELLQQTETINQESVSNIAYSEEEDDLGLFAFDDLLSSITDESENLPPEWNDFLGNLPAYKIDVLKALIIADNPNTIIKQIAEANITMPNLLIDSINEIASNTIGELIIQTSTDIPEINEEYMFNVKKIIAKHENQGS